MKTLTDREKNVFQCPNLIEDVQFIYKNTKGEEHDLVIGSITTDTSAHGINPIKINTIVMLEIF